MVRAKDHFSLRPLGDQSIHVAGIERTMSVRSPLTHQFMLL